PGGWGGRAGGGAGGWAGAGREGGIGWWGVPRRRPGPATPADEFTVTISTIRLRPALVGDIPITLCRYIGRKMFKPTIEPQPKLFIVRAQRGAGSRRIASGISGSGADRSRITKAMASRGAIPPR